MQFIPETTWYALPLSYLDSKSQELWKEFLNQTDIIEFPAGNITSDRRSQEYIHQNFTIVPNEDYELSQTNTRYKEWSTIIEDPEKSATETETDGSTTETF